MIKYKICGKTVELYNSVDEMPIVNYQKFNKLLLLDSGIGSNTDDVDKHLQRIAKLMRADIKAAYTELQNLRINLHFICSNISPKYMSFAALIHSIDGKIVTDLSDDNLKKIISDLSATNNSLVNQIIEKIKKKVDTELTLYFPVAFSSPKEKEVYSKLKQKTTLVLDSIVNGNNNAEKINNVDDFLFKLYKPKCFTGEKSVEIEIDLQFENSCVLISQRTGKNAKALTVLEYYSTLEYVKKQIDAEAKSIKKTKHGKAI